MVRFAASPFSEEELNLLSAVAGQMAVAMQKSEGMAAAERLAAQMAVLYDLGPGDDGAARPARALRQGGGGSGPADRRRPHVGHALDPADGWLSVFAAWARDRTGERYASPIFKLGEGVAGRVALDRRPAS